MAKYLPTFRAEIVAHPCAKDRELAAQDADIENKFPYGTYGKKTRAILGPMDQALEKLQALCLPVDKKFEAPRRRRRDVCA